MGRAIGIAAAVFVAFGVAACGGGSKAQRASEPEAQAEAQTEPAAVDSSAESAPEAAAPVPATKIAVMPAEADAVRKWPKLSAALEESLLEARVGNGVGRASKVPLDVVQISIECVEPTARCYAAVAGSLEVDQLFFGKIDAPDGKPRVKVTRTGRDGSVVGEAEATYDSEDAATSKVKALVDRAAGGGT